MGAQADLVILLAYTMFNVQLLLHSQYGQPYDPSPTLGVMPPETTPTNDLVGQWLLRRREATRSTRSVASVRSDVYQRVQRRISIGRAAVGRGGGCVGQVQTVLVRSKHPAHPGTPAWAPTGRKAVKDNYLGAAAQQPVCMAASTPTDVPQLQL